MKLRTQLIWLIVLTTAVLGVAVGSLQLIAHDLKKTDRQMDEAIVDLDLYRQLAEDCGRFFHEKYQEAAQDEALNEADESKALVEAGFQKLIRLAASREAADEAFENTRLRSIETLFADLARRTDAAIALKRAGKDYEEELEYAVEEGYERKLLPELTRSIQHEQNELRARMNATGDLARRSTFLAIGTALLGILGLSFLVHGIARGLSGGTAQLIQGLRAFALGKSAPEIGALDTPELHEIGQAINAMADEVRRAQESKIRVEKLAAVGQLAASVGHELRNPLSAARNAIHFVNKSLVRSDPNGSDRVQQFLALADRELGVCNRIIQDLLDFARERKLNLSACPLRALVAEVTEVVQVPEGATLENAIAEELPSPNLDRDQFRQVVINLIQNAVDALSGRQGGVVKVTAQHTDGGLVLCVTDDGQGMSDQTLKQIFEPLYTTKMRGTGLGLAIVKTIVERHGGTIAAKSTLGEGSAFSVTVPLPRRADQQKVA